MTAKVSWRTSLRRTSSPELVASTAGRSSSEGGIEAAYRAELETAEDPAATLAGIRARLDAVRSPLRTGVQYRSA
jgi:hypothetical protein